MVGAGSDSGSRLGGNFGVGWNLVCSFQPKEMAYVSIGNNRDGQAADPTKEEAPPRTARLVFLGNSLETERRVWLLARSISTYQRFGQIRSPGRRGGTGRGFGFLLGGTG